MKAGCWFLAYSVEYEKPGFWTNHEPCRDETEIRLKAATKKNALLEALSIWKKTQNKFKKSNRFGITTPRVIFRIPLRRAK